MTNAMTTQPEIKTCNTCCQRADVPFRRHDDHGKIVHGCVDAFHTESLRGIISESTRWHFRPEAKKIRASMTKFSQRTR